MQLSVTGRQLEITTALRSYVESKIQRLEKHYENITQAHVILEVDKLRHKAEANIHLSGCDIFAESEAEDMYASIDSMVDKLIRQVQKHKEKIANHHHNKGRKGGG